MTFNTDFCYAYGKPLATGAIRSCPEDFKVFEIPDFGLCGSGEHVYLKIRKTNANTGWVAARLAEFAGISHKDIGFAGRKDRYAITEQWFSCYLPGERDIKWEGLEIEGVVLLDVTRHTKKLRKGDLTGNLFELTLRHIADRHAVEKSLNRVRDSGVPNYFGEQRFGRDNGNLDFADELLKGCPAEGCPAEGRPAKGRPAEGCRSIRHNRDIYLSAARAYMFNHFLSTKITRRSWEEISAIEFGPLYGMSRDPREGENDLPRECQQWCAGLQSLRIKSGTRNLKLRPKNLQWRFSGDSLQLTFTLTAGSFATSLLREVLDYNSTHKESNPSSE